MKKASIALVSIDLIVCDYQKKHANNSELTRAGTFSDPLIENAFILKCI